MSRNDTALQIYAYFRRHTLLRPLAGLLMPLAPWILTRERLAQLVEKMSRDPGLPCANPTSSVWQDPPHATLTTAQSSKLPERTDVVIIGSGITAASIANYLLTGDRHISVSVVEARTLTSGATGRNGGHILELPYEEYHTQVLLLGREATKSLVKFRLSHLEEIMSFSRTELTEKAVSESEIRVVEAVDAIFDADQWINSKSQLTEYLNDFPDQADKWKVWEGEEARKRFNLEYVQGCITGPSGAIWPYRFVTNLFESLVKRFPSRMSIETATPVQEVTTTNYESEHPYMVTTPRGTIRAKHVVHATNGHVSHLLPHMRGKIFPIRGQMTVQQLHQSQPNMGNERSWIFRFGKGFDYMTQNAKSGLYFLGGGAMQGDNGGLDDVGNPADDEQNFLALSHLTGVLSRVFRSPDTPDKTFDGGKGYSTVQSSWTGIMGFSCDGLPWVGKLPGKISNRYPRAVQKASVGEWIAAGFCGSGMVYCWRSGRALASMILTGDTAGLPTVLHPTEQRFKSSAVEEMANHFFALT